MSWMAPTYLDRLKSANLGGKGDVPDKATMLEALQRKSRVIERRTKGERPTDDSGLPDELAINVAERVKGRLDPVCPCCGLVRPAFVLADVSGVPTEITGGHRWACDGCRSRWVREQPPLKDGTRMTPAMMLEFMGAPAEHVERVRLKQRPPPEKIRTVRPSRDPADLLGGR